MNKKRKIIASAKSAKSEYRITRGYLDWLKMMCWRDINGPVFDCLMEWIADDILLLQKIRLLGHKYRERVDRLYPYGLGLNPQRWFRPYMPKVYLNLDADGKLLGGPIFLDGLVKIKILYRLCYNGCFLLGTILDDAENCNNRCRLIIIDAYRDITISGNILSKLPSILLNLPSLYQEKITKYHQVLINMFPLIKNIAKEEYLPFCLQPASESDTYHYTDTVTGEKVCLIR